MYWRAVDGCKQRRDGSVDSSRLGVWTYGMSSFKLTRLPSCAVEEQRGEGGTREDAIAPWNLLVAVRLNRLAAAVLAAIESCTGRGLALVETSARPCLEGKRRRLLVGRLTETGSFL